MVAKMAGVCKVYILLGYVQNYFGKTEKNITASQSLTFVNSVKYWKLNAEIRFTSSLVLSNLHRNIRVF